MTHRRTLHPAPERPELDRLFEEARKQMTAEELAAAAREIAQEVANILGVGDSPDWSLRRAGTAIAFALREHGEAEYARGFKAWQEASAPIGWAVKDFADGWIIFYDRSRAEKEARETGALMAALYRIPVEPELKPRSDEWRPTHRHYKGGLYRVIRDDLTIEATMAPAVLYEGADGRAWVRPRDDFFAVDIARFGGPRFAPLLPPTELEPKP